MDPLSEMRKDLLNCSQVCDGGCVDDEGCRDGRVAGLVRHTEGVTWFVIDSKAKLQRVFYSVPTNNKTRPRAVA